MISAICIREIQDHLKSPAFFLGAIVVVFLTAYATVIAANDYRQRRDDCLAARANVEVKTNRFFIFREPNPMSIFVQGYDTRTGTTAILYPWTIPIRPSGYMSAVETSQPERCDTVLPPIDYAFVVRVILSLLAIFLMYDTIAGEKQRGTLKMVFANSVPRDTVLLGKMFGGWVVIIVLLMVASVVSFAVVLFDPGIDAGAGMVFRFLGIFLVSILYLTVFFTLGMLASVMVDRPPVALIVLLLVWIASTALFPALGGAIAERLVRPPSEDQLEAMRDAAARPLYEEIQQVMEYGRGVTPGDPAFPSYYTRFYEIKCRQSRLVYTVDQAWNDALDRQASLATMCAMASPAVVYDQAVTRIAGTSVSGYNRFLDYMLRVWNRVQEANKVRFSKPEQSKQMLDSIEPFTPGGMGSALSEAALYLGLLGIASIVFFIIAYTGFLRKDVR